MSTQPKSRAISRIEESSAPLAFKVRAGGKHASPGTVPDRIVLRSKVRSLAGMQKEAVVTQLHPAGSTWRMVCDEGPYLSGTDLAPFPLAFYTAGMQFDYLSHLLNNARALGIEMSALELVQDNFYSMHGSFLKGDATGGAQPVALTVKLNSRAPEATLADLIKMSEVSSPAHAAMRTPLADSFALHLNGHSVPVRGVPQSPVTGIGDPRNDFDVHPAPGATFIDDAITKVETAQKRHDVEGGVASSLKSVQNRQLHVHGEARLSDLGLKRTTVWLRKPIGSTFGFASDEDRSSGGHDQAPSGLALLSAGIAFCYLTQISRYARIVKLKLDAVRIVQDTSFSFSGSREDTTLVAAAHPVDTHVFIESRESEETAQRVVRMGAQTCFLHAALTGSFQTRIQGQVNGSVVAVK
ncbi:MAG: OsmC-related (seleno)protein [bacterium]